ncbi:MAG: chemotaxis protein CheW [Bacillota bacterium]|nr:chemotaxis protein CheW [Bacillota bacterium]
MTNLQEFVIFRLNKEFYGINIQYVENIEKVVPITRVPYTLPQVKGVVNLRGIIVPIIDLRVRFGLSPIETTDDSRMIIVNYEDYKIGLLVDSSSEVLPIQDDEVDLAPSVSREPASEYIKNIGKKNGRVIMLIDLMKVLGLEESSVV